MNNPHRYVILIEPTDDGGFGAWAPDPPGCVAVGDTVTEAAAEMREAIIFHLDGLREDGPAAPQPSIASAIVEIAA